MSSTEDTSVEAQQNSTTKEEEKPLTAEQKLRIEQNRQKALLLKRKNQENSQTKYTLFSFNGKSIKDSIF